MSTTVTITFTGLCMFTKFDNGGKDKGVLVRLPNASPTGQTLCHDYQLRPHVGQLITSGKYFCASDVKCGFSVEGLNTTIDAAASVAPLDVPDYLASVSDQAGSTVDDEIPSRVLSWLRLRGGAFDATKAVKAPSPVSGMWMGPAGRLEELRWQVTWSGQVQEDTLTLPTSGGDIELVASGSKIDMAIVNVLPEELLAWQQPDGVPLPTPPAPASGAGAQDFRWFFTMFNWQSPVCATQTVPSYVGLPAGTGRSLGLEYTCVMGGS